MNPSNWFEELVLRFRFRWNQWRCRHIQVERLVPHSNHYAIWHCRACGKEWK